MTLVRQTPMRAARQVASLLMALYFSLYSLAQSTALAPIQSLYALPEGVETRWASPENPGGEKANGAHSNGERKGRAAIDIKAAGQVTLAEVHGSCGTIRRIWITPLASSRATMNRAGDLSRSAGPN